MGMLYALKGRRTLTLAMESSPILFSTYNARAARFGASSRSSDALISCVCDSRKSGFGGVLAALVVLRKSRLFVSRFTDAVGVEPGAAVQAAGAGLVAVGRVQTGRHRNHVGQESARSKEQT